LPRILDVGCGPSKYPGAIGVDVNPKTAADVLCDLVARSGGTIFIVTPHHTDIASYTDPTHRRHLSSESFHYFYPGGKHGQESWYTHARLRERRLNVKLLRVWRILGLELLVNRARWFRRFWEQYLSFVIRGKVMEFTFEVMK